MSSELRFPPGFKADDEFTEVALDMWKEQNGFHGVIRIGDLDHQSLRQVLAIAQNLKTRSREKSA
jgi:hypothetical protein